MNEVTPAYPLCWPAGWRRTPVEQRETAKFCKKVAHYIDDWKDGKLVGKKRASWDKREFLSIAEATSRVLEELERMGIERDDVVISSNLRLRLNGLPASQQRAPDDCGAAIYWRKGAGTRCMAIDRYNRVQDNLAAIAATLDAMRAIERHGGAAILDRAFQGFIALPAPTAWWQTLKLKSPDVSRDDVISAHRRLAMEHHPDRGGDSQQMASINEARDQGLEAV